jgi:hypothetical protein
VTDLIAPVLVTYITPKGRKGSKVVSTYDLTKTLRSLRDRRYTNVKVGRYHGK